MLSSWLGHDVQIGDYATLSSMCHILGNVQIGSGVFMGSNVVVAPHANIEDDAYVGIGSVVLRRVKKGKRVFGNPAREMDF